MNTLVVVYVLLIVLALIAGGLWLYAQGIERRSVDAELEHARNLATLEAVVTNVPCGVVLLTDTQRVARTVSPATRRILRHGCEVDSPFSHLLASVANEALRLEVARHLSALCQANDATDPAIGANPLAHVLLDERELYFRFHRIRREAAAPSILVTIEEQRLAAVADAARNEPAAAPDWLATALAAGPDKRAAFLAEAASRSAQIRAIVRMPTRVQRAFQEKLRKLQELVAALRAGGEATGLATIVERANRFDQLLAVLDKKERPAGNDFLPLAQALDDLVSHCEELRRVAKDRAAPPAAAAPEPPVMPASNLADDITAFAQSLCAAQAKAIKVVTVGLEDVPRRLLLPLRDILRQLAENALAHGIEAPIDRVRAGKPSAGTLIVQFRANPGRGFELSFQDDGRGLDYERLRELAVAQGVLTTAVAATIDPRKLASLIFRPGFSTAAPQAETSAAKGVGMHLVREQADALGGKVGVATRPGEFTRFRILLPDTRTQRVA